MRDQVESTVLNHTCKYCMTAPSRLAKIAKCNLENRATQSGFGIPVATDIAFSLGGVSLQKRRVSVSLKVVLTALAMIDDLGAVLVIAFFYVRDLSIIFLACSLGAFVALIVLNRLEIDNIVVYLAWES